MARWFMRTQEEVRRGRLVAYTCMVSGVVFAVVGALGGTGYAAIPAFMMGLAGGAWLGRATEASARMTTGVDTR